MLIITSIDIKCSLCGAHVPTEEMIEFDPNHRRYTFKVLPCECKDKTLTIHNLYPGKYQKGCNQCADMGCDACAK